MPRSKILLWVFLISTAPWLFSTLAEAQDNRGNRDDSGSAASRASAIDTPDHSRSIKLDVSSYEDRYDRGVEDVERALRLGDEASPELRVPQRGGEVSKIVDRTVRGRFRPRFDPQGVLVDGFWLYPRVGISAGYDGNVYRTSDGVDDLYLVPSATLKANSTWGRHSLIFNGSASQREYANYTSENGTQYAGSLDGRLDVTGRSTLNARLSHSHVIRDRGAAGELPDSLSPIRYDETIAALSGYLSSGRIGLVLSGEAQRRVYEDAQTLMRTPLDQSYRNLRQFIILGEGQYYFNPRVYGFASLEYDHRRFRQTNGLENRDIDTAQILFGIRGDITPLIYGGIGVGLLNQHFLRPGIEDKLGLALNTDLNWLITPLTTIRFTAARTVRNSGLRETANYTSLTFSLGADHELLRNVLLNASIEHQIATYVNSPRVDRLPSAQVGVEWLINRSLRASLQTTIRHRNSNITDRPAFFNFGTTLGLTYAL